MGDTAISSPRGLLNELGRWLVRLFMIASAVLLALILSGGIFRVVPGVTIAHTNGTSMEPTYKSGDVVVLHVENPKSVHAGEVILFQEDGMNVTHRVIEVGPNQGSKTVIVTKGDNNPGPDKAIKLTGVQGKVVGKLPWLGEISRWSGAGGGFYVYHYAALLLNLILVLAYVAVSVARINAQSKRPLTS